MAVDDASSATKFQTVRTARAGTLVPETDERMKSRDTTIDDCSRDSQKVGVSFHQIAPRVAVLGVENERFVFGVVFGRELLEQRNVGLVRRLENGRDNKVTLMASVGSPGRYVIFDEEVHRLFRVVEPVEGRQKVLERLLGVVEQSDADEEARGAVEDGPDVLLLRIGLDFGAVVFVFQRGQTARAVAAPHGRHVIGQPVREFFAVAGRVDDDRFRFEVDVPQNGSRVLAAANPKLQVNSGQ